MKRLLFLLAAIGGISAATGCGQSGPLYLPGDPSEVRQVSPPVEQEPEDAEEEADESP